MKVKKCSTCSEVKPIVKFYKDKSKKDKLRPECKVCTKTAAHKLQEGYREQRENGSVVAKFKLCPKCGKEKLLGKFYVCPSRPDGYRGNCKECEIKSVIQWHKTPTGKRSYTNSKLKKRYGITVDDYDQMLEDQSGVCAICGRLNKHGRRLCVDHDHSTGKVRGLLCDRCNAVIGYMYDDVELFEKTSKYLTT